MNCKKVENISKPCENACKKRAEGRYASPLVGRRHDTMHFHDPLAKPGRVTRKHSVGDGDIWVEKLLKNVKSGNIDNFFVSTKTGIKHRHEPPTGASNVVYLKQSVKDRY